MQVTQRPLASALCPRDPLAGALDKTPASGIV
jgi:hypothetical protein